MYAMADVHEMDPSVPYTTTIEASEIKPPAERDTRYIVEYEDYSGSDDRLKRVFVPCRRGCEETLDLAGRARHHCHIS